jgi:acyl-CoA thioesterase
VSDLEEALTLTRANDGSWKAFADPRYEAGTGMFGGWTAAVMLRSVMDDAARLGQPSALTANYVGKVDPGSGVMLRSRRVGGSRSIHHWKSELLAADDGRVLAHAMLVFAERRDTDGFTESTMPNAPDPDSLDELHPPGAFGERCVYRPITGNPPFAQESTASTCWLRETTGRKVDYLQLTFLADANAPRSFFWSDGPRRSATMTMSVYFHGTDDEIDAVGNDYLFNECIGTRGAHSTNGQQMRLWRRDGVLLATSEQLAWYR